MDLYQQIPRRAADVQNTERPDRVLFAKDDTDEGENLVSFRGKDSLERLCRGGHLMNDRLFARPPISFGAQGVLPGKLLLEPRIIRRILQKNESSFPAPHDLP